LLNFFVIEEFLEFIHTLSLLSCRRFSSISLKIGKIFGYKGLSNVTFRVLRFLLFDFISTDCLDERSAANEIAILFVKLVLKDVQLELIYFKVASIPEPPSQVTSEHFSSAIEVNTVEYCFTIKLQRLLNVKSGRVSSNDSIYNVNQTVNSR